MKKEKIVNLLSTSVVLAGIVVKAMQARLDEEKLKKIVSKEVQNQLNQKE